LALKGENFGEKSFVKIATHPLKSIAIFKKICYYNLAMKKRANKPTAKREFFKTALIL